MKHYDTETTQTDWDEFEQETPGDMPEASLDNGIAHQGGKRSVRSEAKLKQMFDKFLYQRPLPVHNK